MADHTRWNDLERIRTLEAALAARDEQIVVLERRLRGQELAVRFEKLRTYGQARLADRLAEVLRLMPAQDDTAESRIQAALAAHDANRADG